MIIEPIYVDTSAFYALMDRSDLYHESAKALWPSLLESHIHLTTSNYIVAETVTLIQYRLGFEAAAVWYKDILGVLEVCWVNEAVHRHAYELWMSLGRQNCSLIDCVSFTAMNQRGIEKAFCFKERYVKHGYKVLPGREGGPLFKSRRPHRWSGGHAQAAPDSAQPKSGSPA